MEPSPSTDALSTGRSHALLARIQLLEQHALTVLAAFRAEAMKADARDVIAALNRATAWLGAVPGDVAAVEDLVEKASQQLSSLGATNRVVSLPTPRVGGFARRAADHLPAGTAVPRRLRDRRATVRRVEA